MPVAIPFAVALRLERQRQRGTISELAEMLGVHSNTVVGWENGTSPLPRYYDALCELMPALKYAEPPRIRRRRRSLQRLEASA